MVRGLTFAVVHGEELATWNTASVRFRPVEAPPLFRPHTTKKGAGDRRRTTPNADVDESQQSASLSRNNDNVARARVVKDHPCYSLWVTVPNLVLLAL